MLYFYFCSSYSWCLKHPVLHHLCLLKSCLSFKIHHCTLTTVDAQYVFVVVNLWTVISSFSLWHLFYLVMMSNSVIAALPLSFSPLLPIKNIDLDGSRRKQSWEKTPQEIKKAEVAWVCSIELKLRKPRKICVLWLFCQYDKAPRPKQTYRRQNFFWFTVPEG